MTMPFRLQDSETGLFVAIGLFVRIASAESSDG